MNLWIYRIALPACLAAFYLGVGVHRARMRRRLGHDPIRSRPGQDLESPAGLIDAVLPVTGTVMVVDVVLNALRPDFVAGLLAVPLLRRSALLGYSGLGLVLLGLALTIVAVTAMGASWRVGIDRDRPGPLVTGSIFGRVRHPIYAGQLLLAVGVALLTADVLSLPAASAATLGLMAQARIEEDFLAATYPEYAAYRQRTGRFWPKLH